MDFVVMVKSLALIESRIEGAHELLHATHDYIKWQAPTDIYQMDPEYTYLVSYEAMRITVRMTQIIAWLLLQKAVVAEEISREEALSEDCRVLHGKHCLESEGEDDEDLPPRLRELLKESRKLYICVLRLDTLSRKK
ncbi:MAG: DUF1465 family protein [Proteobacteria bacterium]|nr:DUF1465 family protein [Pseudomonadota bacterium]